MMYSQAFTEKKEYLLCVSDGTVADVEHFIEWAMSLVSKAKETGYSRLLIDNRTFVLELSSLDVITFAKYLEDMGAATFGLRLAALTSPMNVEISRLVETSLTNRSASYKIFQSLAEAKEWLVV
ncbi:hypothetical protein [Pseudodesulfovibrio nedwellii]|nr:hypothetical protein [Pseudodesulfovibrio nedwellii]